MQGEQRERLVALATKVAAENDPAKFHALLLELKELLDEQKPSIRGDGKTLRRPPAN